MKYRSIALCIVLSIITCGLYGIYWFVCATDDTNEVSSCYLCQNRRKEVSLPGFQINLPHLVCYFIPICVLPVIDSGSSTVPTQFPSNRFVGYVHITFIC